MTNHTTFPSIAAPTLTRPAPKTGAWRFIFDRFLLLPIGALIALAWANLSGESYFTFTHKVSFVVNEIAMAIFLALVAQELLEALIPGGALRHWRHWGMAVVAGFGAVVGAVGTYYLYVQVAHEEVLFMAWPVALAVDVAAGYYVLKMIWHRSTAIPFLLLVAIVTDTIGLAVVTLRVPSSEIHFAGIALLAAAVGLAAMLRVRHVRRFWPYLVICGAMSWWGLYWAGLHPALALAPIVPFLPHSARWDVFEEPGTTDAVRHTERDWTLAAQIVLFFFGLVNAGVILRGRDTGTWAILVAALVGRPAGILAAVALGRLVGLHLPRHLGWRDVIVVALATSSGFTFALFFASSVVPVGAVLTQIKIGTLATVAGAALAVVAAWILGVGQFAKRPIGGVDTWRIG